MNDFYDQDYQRAVLQSDFLRLTIFKLNSKIEFELEKFRCSF
ncbi:hypothetical protein HMPREF9104_03050 [Lentilactobacillus kisonensis F0435]|uniref:Uncharacterized protein n=1 Tax=Lentilactobacillus kisonensis F0435 TaxID=797516 RepID=H1LKA4_9LACO|nr:hypothetical protein HMPREF9104_03050 [Lentilactobacillus kisonensis F0435]